ncbi:hypothetical protein KI387_000645, partial [Taxus chinensis]
MWRSLEVVRSGAGKMGRSEWETGSSTRKERVWEREIRVQVAWEISVEEKPLGAGWSTLGRKEIGMEKERGKKNGNGLNVKKREHEESAMEDFGDGAEFEFLKNEDLDKVSEFKRGNGFIEMRCGCTCMKYGDAVGRLRIYHEGDFKVLCECSPGCDAGELSPSAFEKHAGRENARKWKNNIWIIIDGEKVPLSKTMFLKYYSKVSRNGRGHQKGHNKHSCHHDEFIRCSKCNKERRFKLRNKEECRIYHDASRNLNWVCADLPYD